MTARALYKGHLQVSDVVIASFSGRNESRGEQSFLMMRAAVIHLPDKREMSESGEWMS